MRIHRPTIIVWTIIAAIVVAGGGVFAFVPIRPPPLDKQLCLSSGTLPGHVVVLVDQTDALTDDQVTALSAEVHGLEDDLARYERLSIFTIGDEVQLPPLPIFSLCNPGRKDQVNKWTETASRRSREFESKFGQPLQDVLEELAVRYIGTEILQL